MKNKQEKLILSQLYNNTADSIKFLPFFFKNQKELRRFFNQYGGKTLVLPETYEEYIKYILQNTDIPKSTKRRGIDKNIHERTKNRILQTYLRLFDSLEDVIRNECE